MPLLSLIDVSYRTAAKTICDRISFAIEPGDRCALVGLNGAGKSTLLKILAGTIAPDHGTVFRSKGGRVEYVPQSLPGELRNVSLIDAVVEKLREAGTPSYMAEAMLGEAGFDEGAFSQTLGSLSGGQVNRALFVLALAGAPDLLLLDEPTNHMDIAGVELFEAQLTSLVDTAMVIVSHDRDLLDAVTERTVFLRDNKLYSFGLPYSRAREALLECDGAALEKRRDEEREIARLRDSVRQLAGWAKRSGNEKFARRAHSIEQRVVRLQKERTFVSLEKAAQVSLATGLRDGKSLLRCAGLDVGAPDGRHLFSIRELVVRKGDRIAVVGENGCGKSTFLKTVVRTWKEQLERGPIQFTPGLKLGYYDQELKHLDDSQTIEATVAEVCFGNRQTIINALVRAGFPYARHGDRIGALSGGERARLSFLLLHLMKPELLVLDEPTNHLDVEGIEELEEQLCSGAGGCVFVSHDRRFIARVATATLSISSLAEGKQ